MEKMENHFKLMNKLSSEKSRKSEKPFNKIQIERKTTQRFFKYRKKLYLDALLFDFTF